MPVFDAEAREQARRNAHSALVSTMENTAYAESRDSAQQQLSAQIEELVAKKYDEFSSHLDHRLDSFDRETAHRLDVLSEEIVRRFCEVLNRQMTEALSSAMAEWSEQNRALANAECQAVLDRFASRLERISSSELENHRKEIRNLSAHLKIRLRGVAQALEEFGPAVHRSY